MTSCSGTRTNTAPQHLRSRAPAWRQISTSVAERCEPEMPVGPDPDMPAPLAHISPPPRCPLAHRLTPSRSQHHMQGSAMTQLRPTLETRFILLSKNSLLRITFWVRDSRPEQTRSASCSRTIPIVRPGRWVSNTQLTYQPTRTCRLEPIRFSKLPLPRQELSICGARISRSTSRVLIRLISQPKRYGADTMNMLLATTTSSMDTTVAAH